MLRALVADLLSDLRERRQFRDAVLEEIADRHGWIARQAAASLVVQPGFPTFAEIAITEDVEPTVENAPAVADAVVEYLDRDPAAD